MRDTPNCKVVRRLARGRPGAWLLAGRAGRARQCRRHRQHLRRASGARRRDDRRHAWHRRLHRSLRAGGSARARANAEGSRARWRGDVAEQCVAGRRALSGKPPNGRATSASLGAHNGGSRARLPPRGGTSGQEQGRTRQGAHGPSTTHASAPAAITTRSEPFSNIKAWSGSRTDPSKGASSNRPSFTCCCRSLGRVQRASCQAWP